jgi:hypothetical protein
MPISKINTTSITDNSVTAGKIVAGAVDADIAAGSIDTAQIADDAVTADKLANAINTSIDAKLPLTGGTMTGTTAHGDGVASTFGDSADLTISHAGGNTYLTNTTGSLVLRSDSFRVLNTANSEQILHGTADGAVVAYHNNAEKLTTTASGINVTGAVNSTGEMRITNPSATSQLYLYGASGQKANIILNEYGVRAWHIGAGTQTSGNFSISDGSTERFRIASNARLTINGNAGSNAHGNFVGEVGASGRALEFENTVGGGGVGTVITSASSTSYNTNSDHRLKENVVYDWDATTRLKQLKPARFNFIADPDITVDGFLAHEAQSVVPESVHGTLNGMRDETDEEGNVTSVPDMQGIDQSKLVPLLVKTIQELEARITALEDA